MSNLPSRQITFAEAIEETEKEEKNRHILIGNGFSIAWSKEFENRNLVQKASKDDELKEYFSKDNPNFESALGKVQAEKVHDCLVEFYMKDFFSYISEQKRTDSNVISDDELLQKVKSLISEVKEKPSFANEEKILKDLIDAVSEAQQIHVDDYRDRYRNCANFLLRFNKLFTVNYDELFYKAYLAANEAVNFRKRFTDNFDTHGEGAHVWCNTFPNKDGKVSEQRVFFLHGALFFYVARETKKIMRIKSAGSEGTLAQEIDSALDEGIKPLCVAGATSDEKLKEIQRNEYLSKCYEQLKKLKGVIFVYGHSASKEDKHIYDALFTNKKIKHLYYCMLNTENAFMKNGVDERLQQWKIEAKSPLTISYVEIADLDIWGIKQFIRIAKVKKVDIEKKVLKVEGVKIDIKYNYENAEANDIVIYRFEDGELTAKRFYKPKKHKPNYGENPAIAEAFAKAKETQ